MCHFLTSSLCFDLIHAGGEVWGHFPRVSLCHVRISINFYEYLVDDLPCAPFVIREIPYRLAESKSFISRAFRLKQESFLNGVKCSEIAGGGNRLDDGSVTNEIAPLLLCVRLWQSFTLTTLYGRIWGRWKSLQTNRSPSNIESLNSARL
jgi:hypothetical protein